MTATKTRAGTNPSGRGRPRAQGSGRKPPARKSPARKPSAKKSAAGSTAARNLTARAEEVRAERRQRRRSVVAVLLALSIAAAAGIGFLRSPLMAIDSVAVRGASVVSEQQIVAVSGVSLGSPILDLPLEVVAARVESIPEIRSATVTRSLTGVITVSVVEREPAMALRSAEGFVLVDGDGRQIRTTVEAPDGFLPVIGLEATGIIGDPAPPGASSVLNLMEEITPPVRAAVSEVVVTGEQLSLRLVDGGRVVLGDDRDVRAKVISLETMLVQVDLRCVHQIDLTVPSAPALSRIGEKGNPRDGIADLTTCN